MEGTVKKKQINKSRSNSKSKKKPMKVVYISSPMKFKICASKFRDLVQELTGQDAELPDPNKIVHDSNVGVDDVRDTITTTTTATKDASRTVNLDDVDDDKFDCGDLLIGDFDVGDDVFVPQMFKNFPELIPVELGA